MTRHPNLGAVEHPFVYSLHFVQGKQCERKGPIQKMTYGNGLTETEAYNKRLQPCRMNLNSSATMLQGCADPVPSGNLLDLNYGFNLGAGDNGNVTTWAAVGQQSFSRSYGYDQVNRLLTMADTGPGPCQGLSWTYDPWGNRQAQTPTGGTCNPSQQTINTNNQIADPGYQYDAAGNLIAAPGGTSYQYDAENRLVSINNGAIASYVYDASGRRIRKTAGGTTTDFVYDSGGSVMAEYQGSAYTKGYVYLGGQMLAQYDNTASPATTYFAHQDHLGSTRLLTTVSASVQECDDYYPFGELTPCGASSTTTTHKFTGKERDSESGLDHFQFRNLASTMGRFISPDPINLTAKRQINPANTLNKYVYGGNNPLLYVDPSGRDITVFYRASTGAGGDAGHVLLAVTNQATGQVRFADYYPKGHKGVLPTQGEMNQAVTSDRLKEHAALTIQTSPEVAQALINSIDALSKDVPTFMVPFSDCVTVCSDLLSLAGIDPGSATLTPEDLWSTLYATYSAEAIEGGQFKMGFYRYAVGRDFGSPMSVFRRGTDPSWNLQVLGLIADRQRQPQKKRKKPCVEWWDPKTNTLHGCP